MVSIKEARSSNADPTAQLQSPTALIVGGSSGIGQAIAFKLAQYSITPRIIISARNPKTGQATLDKLQQINPNGSYQFIACDMTLSNSITNLSTTIKSLEKKLNYLVMSAGVLNMNGRVENPDGIDVKMMFAYYGKVLLVTQLLSLLESTPAESHEPARVLSVYAAAKSGGKFYFDDLGLRDHYGFKTAYDATTAYNDFAIEQLSLLHPTVGFMHAYPGWVDTDIGNGLPLVLKYLAKLFSFLAIKPEDCGDWLVYGMNRPEHATGWYLLHQNGQVVPKKKYQTEDARAKIWQHTLEVLKLK